ncbi:hypothetical protein Tco_0949938 [Tanacetum coccineum]
MIIPGPAGIVQASKQKDIREGGEEYVMSTQECIRKVVEDVGKLLRMCLGDIKKNLKNEKLDQVIAIIKSCAPDALGDLIVALKDLSVFFPKPSMHYLTIIMRNLVKVFHKDAIPRNGRGVGGSEMLNKEEIIKLLEEEELVELEL